MKGQKGITLIALIITIIILLILAIITIGSIQDSNIITYAKNASSDYGEAKDKEESIILGYETVIEEKIPLSLREPISKTTSFVGCYADVDRNGIVDGIIYADLAFDASGQWIDEDGKYSYNKKDILNNYYISKEKYKYENFEENPVIAPIDEIEDNDRFYVMALTDLNLGTKYCWYYASASYKEVIKVDKTGTLQDFGSGKENTINMIKYWENAKNIAEDADIYNKDIWGQIDAQVSDNWFVPSKEELGAFGFFVASQGLTKDNYKNYGLSAYYWSSSVRRFRYCLENELFG